MSRERELYDEAGKRIKREMDEYYYMNPTTTTTSSGQMGIRRQILINPVPVSLNTITPCAACKLLRRRCAEECPFSPYFSPHEPFKFAAVHKVFGASNVSKLLMVHDVPPAEKSWEVPESQRADAANSLVYEANVRLRDPIYGCMGAISSLQQQIQSLQADLNAVRAEILRYKYRQAAAANTHDISIIASTLVSSDPIMATGQLSTVQAPPTPPPPPRPSIIISSSSSSSSSSSNSAHLYGIPSSTSGYSTSTIVTNNNNSSNVTSYFG